MSDKFQRGVQRPRPISVRFDTVGIGQCRRGDIIEFGSEALIVNGPTNGTKTPVVLARTGAADVMLGPGPYSVVRRLGATHWLTDRRVGELERDNERLQSRLRDIETQLPVLREKAALADRLVAAFEGSR